MSGDEYYLLDELVPKPFPSIDWLKRKLNAGAIQGYKVGRRWVMTKQQVQQAIEDLHNNSIRPKQDGPAFATATTKRRKAS